MNKGEFLSLEKQVGCRDMNAKERKFCYEQA